MRILTRNIVFKKKGFFFDLNLNDGLTQELFKDLIAKSSEEVECEVTIKKVQKSKSLPQVRYWKGPMLQQVLMAFRGAGYDFKKTDEAEDYIKELYFYEERQAGDEIIKVKKSFADEDVTEEVVSKLIGEVINFCDVYLSTYIETPEDYYAKLK